MSSTTTSPISDPSQLFVYNSGHSVLICLKCQYAVQKSALSSHLLRHKIYRQERAKLLSSLSHLQLLDPDDVLPPKPTEEPVVGLSLMNGWRCGVRGCGRLFESIKRMKRHYGDVHHGEDASSTVMMEVKMQTFFRGTKIKYFEVGSRTGQGDSSTSRIDTQSESSGGGFEEDMLLDPDVNTRMPPIPAQQTLTSLSSTLNSNLNVDLEKINYFHHFLTTIIPSLAHTVPNQYWQTSFIPLALQSRWLSCGLLALSASHCAALAGGFESKRRHFQCMLTFKQDFETDLDEDWISENIVVGDLFPDPKIELKQAGVRIRCFLRLACWATIDTQMEQESSLDMAMEPFSVLAFMDTLLELASINSKSVMVLNHDIQNEQEQQTFIQAKRILEGHADTCPPSTSSSHPTAESERSATRDSQKEAALHRLHKLPYQMAAAFPNPDSNRATEILTTLSTIASLVECCEVSFSGEDGARWAGMMKWVISIGNAGVFWDMIGAEKHEALVVVAHWVDILVRRVEESKVLESEMDGGNWLLKGMTEKCLKEIGELLVGVWEIGSDWLETD